MSYKPLLFSPEHIGTKFEKKYIFNQGDISVTLGKEDKAMKIRGKGKICGVRNWKKKICSVKAKGKAISRPQSLGKLLEK